MSKKFNYNSHTISPYSNLYDRLFFPFIFINEKGGAGYSDKDIDFLDDGDNEEDNELYHKKNEDIIFIYQIDRKSISNAKK